MLRYFCFGLLCSCSVFALAQFNNEAAIEELAEAIVRQVGTEYSCELRVLWTFNARSQDERVVRVYADGQECEQALARATELGRALAIRFATLKDIEDERPVAPTAPGRSPANPRRDPDQTPAPPSNFDLIDDRIELTQ